MLKNRQSGMFTFTIVWVGQAFSLLGTSMTAFAMTIWAFQLTGSATVLALVGVFHMTPLLILSPLAGAIVDRSNRKLMMMLTDLSSGVVTIVYLILFLSDGLQIWHLYLGSVITGIFQTFQWPAYSAAITMIVPKKHYARAHALNELAGNSSGIFAPLLAGALLAVIGLGGILAIDILALVIAVGSLLIVQIPQPKASQEGAEGKGSIWKESAYGFRYIFRRPSLLGLQLVFLVGNFFIGLSYTVLAPMILARTDNNSLIFGSVQTAGAVGGLVGGLLISAWGGPRRKVHGILGGWILSGLFGVTVMGLGQALPFWIIGSFMGAFSVPLINSSNQAIWQSKVAPDVQGRVFAIRRLIAWLVSPLAMLIAGPLADFVLEPGMRGSGWMVETFGQLVGTGPGAGMALLMIVGGVLSALVGLGGYFVRVVRDAEVLLPDHEVAAGSGPEVQNRVAELLAELQRLKGEPHTPHRDQALQQINEELNQLGYAGAQAD
jgi:MFS transporter, DHA3 family, macrolide efflux protein